jgi:hypothetical protein
VLGHVAAPHLLPDLLGVDDDAVEVEDDRFDGAHCGPSFTIGSFHRRKRQITPYSGTHCGTQRNERVTYVLSADPKRGR